VRSWQEGGFGPRISVLFAAGTQEKGLFGSARYGSEPVFPLENAVGMIQLDVVGLATDGVMTVDGVGNWRPARAHQPFWIALAKRAVTISISTAT